MALPPPREHFRWRPRQIGTLVVRTAGEWAEDKCPKQAAALAYYALFALGPLLLIATSLAGLVFGRQAAQRAVVGQASHLVGPQGAAAMEALMGQSLHGGASILGLVVGGVALLFGAIGVFAQLREALNRVWEVEERAVDGWRNKLRQAVRDNLVGFAGLLGTGFLLLVSLLLSTALTALATSARDVLPGPDLVWGLGQAVVTIGLASVLFALMFRFLPNATVAWSDVWVGSVLTAILFVAGEAGIGAYLGNGSVAARYGGGGAILALLLWVYYSGLILFFGAELTQVHANLYGHRIRPSPRGETLQEAVWKRDSPPDMEGLERKPGKRPEGRPQPAPTPSVARHAHGRPTRRTPKTHKTPRAPHRAKETRHA